MGADDRIAAVEDVPRDGSLVFRVSETGDGRGEEEYILVRLADGVVAYENVCPHWTTVPLDRSDGATRREGELVCSKHGATFEVDTGFCTYGPCEGATLTEIEVRVADGAVYLDDDGYAFEGLGPVDDGDDLSSGPNIGFGGT